MVMSSSNRKERVIFGLLCLISIVTIAAYVYWTKAEVVSQAANVMVSPPRSSVPLDAKARIEEEPPANIASARSEIVPQARKAVRRIFFRYNALGADYGKLAFVRQGGLEQLEFAGSLSCEAVYVAGGRGICLKADRGFLTTYEAQIFDGQTFQSLRNIPLQGVPSRCRVSPDGRKAAVTVFVSGHSYASTDFSTQTLLIDTHTAEVLADLEDFSVTRNGQPFKNKDFNFWGVTFTPDSKHFYSTLSTNRQHFLIKGDIAARTASVIHEQVECPSLSPDGERIAYKKRFMNNGRLLWRTQVLDLRTGVEIALQEERSVDDQLEWLDKDQVLYALSASETGASASTNIWAIAADGSQAPKTFLKNAFSPSVER